MQNKTWIGIGSIAIIALLGLAGYLISDKTYYCESRGIVMECERFSSSGLRCYPNLENNKGYRDCPEGWIKLKQAEELNIYANGEMYQCHGKEDYSYCISESGKEAYAGELI